MKKITVILISLILTASFGALVYYGLRHGHGIPTVVERPKRVILEAPFIEKEIELAKGISQDIWKAVSPQEVKLMYQVMVLPWPKVVVPSVSVKAFHNQKDIYFYITWRDDTQDSALGMNKFSDACAVMFPLGEDVQPSSIMMGFIGRANIWHWKASQDREFWKSDQLPVTSNQSLPEVYSDFYYPFEEKELFPVSKTVPKSAVNDLLAIRVGTVTPKETQDVEGRGIWQEGTWHVVFKRSFQMIDPDVDAKFTQPLRAGAGFDVGKKKLCAFAVWNGSKGDRGGRKSISDWVELEIK